MMRNDQLRYFWLKKTKQGIVWCLSREGTFHASLDGLRAICNCRTVLLSEEDHTNSCMDRAHNPLTCGLCADKVMQGALHKGLKSA